MVCLLPDKIPLLVHGPIPIHKLAEPELIPGTEVLMTIHDVVPDEPLEGVRILVGLRQTLLLGLNSLQEFFVHADGIERQLGRGQLEPGLDLFPEKVASDLHDDPARFDRGHVVVDGTLAGAHALANAMAGDGLVRAVHAPNGKTLVLLKKRIKSVKKQIE